MKIKEKVSILSILVNFLLAIFKIGVGILSKSSAVIAEGIHSGMDIISSAISYFGIKFAKKPVDKKHPYGHYKLEILAGLLITFILLLTGIWIVYNALKGFWIVKEFSITYLTLSVMLFSAIINEVMARIKIKFGKKYNSIALLADGQHSRIDVYASIGVLVSLMLIKYWVHLDSLIALLIGIYIIYESLSLGKETTDGLLDIRADETIENRIKKLIKKEGINLSELKTRQIGEVILAELKIKLNPKLSVDKASKITKNLENKLMKSIENLRYVTIQIESHNIKEQYYKGGVLSGKIRWKGRMGGKGLGPGGECICIKCGYKTSHKRGKPCHLRKCPKCGGSMKRKNAVGR